MQPLAVLLAAALTVLALLPLARAVFRSSTFWVLAAIGIIIFPIAQWVNRAVWGPIAASLGISDVGAELIIFLFVPAFLAEAFKLAPVLVVGAMTEARRPEWFAYGVATGAGFSLFAQQAFIAQVLEVNRLGLSTAFDATVAIALRLFPILAHIATTAFVAWAVPRGWLWRALLLATAAQTVLGLVERWQGAIGPSLGWLLFGLIAVALFLYTWTLRPRDLARPSRQPAG